MACIWLAAISLNVVFVGEMTTAIAYLLPPKNHNLVDIFTTSHLTERPDKRRS